ncbi:MAG: HAD hydrolase-like protein [Prolixibacteraceae bacterium]|nr:HAD hydrolase-like protein [Prolixibacteraceae bacterium]
MFSGINTIIWDWNGTLLDDTDLCISTINELLEERKLPTLSKKAYLETFGFPIKDYYQRIGFDFEKEPFDIPAHQYIRKYSARVHHALLHRNVPEVLSALQKQGFRQLVLSASEQQKLEHSLALFGIEHWFEAVAGLDNHFAASKTIIGKKLLKKLNIAPEEACLIGDTIHDFEVATEIGCACILIANGHQPETKLKSTGAKVVQHLGEINTMFKK